MFPFRLPAALSATGDRCIRIVHASLGRAGWLPVLVLVAAPLLALAPQQAANAAQESVKAADQSGPAQPPSSSPMSTEQVVARLQQENQRRSQQLKRYSGRRTYHLEYHGLGSLAAEMVVEAQYDAPGTKQFRIVSEHGSKLLLDRVLRKLLEAEKEAANPATQEKTALSPENYKFELVGEKTIGERHCYALAVEPLIDNKFLYRGKIWVDDQDFAVVQIEAEPAKNPSFWIHRTTIHHEYAKVGDFWLPAQNRSVSNMKVGGTATLTINYGNYVVSPASSSSTVTSK